MEAGHLLNNLPILELFKAGFRTIGVLRKHSDFAPLSLVDGIQSTTNHGTFSFFTNEHNGGTIQFPRFFDAGF